jgi:hypothetical protein
MPCVYQIGAACVSRSRDKGWRRGVTSRFAVKGQIRCTTTCTRAPSVVDMFFPALCFALLWAPALSAPDLSSCSVRYYDQTLDHFSFESPPQPTFKQRYVVCDRNWARNADGRGPIFFYFGNEADVFLYVNHTGLMWENAAAMGAAMVFAEHRYYGQSAPFPDGTAGCLRWLTTDQALADYAQLIRYFKEVRRSFCFIAFL